MRGSLEGKTNALLELPHPHELEAKGWETAGGGGHGLAVICVPTSSNEPLAQFRLESS